MTRTLIPPSEVYLTALEMKFLTILSRSLLSVSGILDHNFAIYRMSGSWKKLLDPIDRFSHSGLIWDKLRLLSLDKAEVNHLENCISSAPNAEGWFNIRTAHSLRVRLEKLYAPDYKHFYYFYGKHTFKKEEETEEREEEHFKFRFQA